MDSKQRRSPEEARRFWELAVDLWSKSGLGVAEFCRHEGLSQSSFFAWQRRLRDENGDQQPVVAASEPVETTSTLVTPGPETPKTSRRKKSTSPKCAVGRWAPVHVVEEGATVETTTPCSTRSRPPIEIILPKGTRIRIDSHCDRALLERVLIALECQPC
jgi:hypothetical protein